MYCRKCGADVKKEDKFCPCCGAELENNVTDEANEGVYETSEPSFESGTTVQEGPSRRDGIATAALIVAGISLVVPGLFIVAIILCLIGLSSNRRIAAKIGLIISAVSALFTLMTIGIIIAALGMFNSQKKREAINDVKAVFMSAKFIISEAEMTGDSLDGYVTISGSDYSVTVTDLLSHGDIRSNPFKNGGSDGGMTVRYNTTSRKYSCDISGTINGYTITYVGNEFKAQ